MKTLINPTITLQESNKKTGAYRYSIELCRRHPHQLTIKAQSQNGKVKRTIGRVDREGKIYMVHGNRWANYILNKVDVFSYQKKIDTVLDLIFGTKRDKFPVLNKNGQTEFIK